MADLGQAGLLVGAPSASPARGRRLRRRARLLALVLAVVGAAPGAGGRALADPTPAPSAYGCSQVALAPVLPTDKGFDGSPIKPSPDSRGKWVPVVMVHGWTSTSTHREKLAGEKDRPGAFSHPIDLTTVVGPPQTVGPSLIGLLQRIPGAAVFTFDYHEYSARWVDDDHLGPALGQAIDCLSKASGEKVIIVAHSMGGLVARWALAHRGTDGRDRAEKVSSVVTFGTPEEGSLLAELLAVGADAGAATDTSGKLAVLRAILTACGQASTAQLDTGTPCDLLPSFIRAFDSQAGQALRSGSAALTALGPFPKAVRVTALAGDIKLHVADLGWFGLEPWKADVGVGDVIVDRDSAIAGAAEHRDGPCTYQLNAVQGTGDAFALVFKQVDANDVAQPLLKIFGTPCFHTNLMRIFELAEVAYRVVLNDISGRRFAPFVGTWRVHGSQLMINADGKGTTDWNAGPCFRTTSSDMCSGHASIQFTASPNGIVGTYTAVWYTTWSGANVPGYDPGTYSTQVGDSFELTVEAEGVLRTKILRSHRAPGDIAAGNPYYCAPQASPTWHDRCNA